MMKRTFVMFLRYIVCFAVLILAGGLIAPVSAGDVEAASAAIISGCKEGLAEIDLKSYALTIDELQDAFYAARNRGALPWYVENSYSYVYIDTAGDQKISSIKPVYLDEETYDRVLYEQAVSEALAETVYPGMSDLEIALSVHDYLAANCVYDESHSRFTAYDALVGKNAVCQGYAEAYMDLLVRNGVPCMLVVSEEMDHTWNLVQIGGSWYHVDLTWDDPTPDRYGQVSHDYFLLSDSLISDEEHEHYAWESPIACDDTSMDTGMFWQGIDSPIYYIDSQTCYLRRDTDNKRISICRFDDTTGELTELHADELDGLSFQDDGYIWFYYHNGLSLWNDRLYFSDTEQVYAMNLDGTELETVFRYDTEANDQYIAGSFVSDATLHLTLSTHDKALSQMTVTLSDASYHTHTYTQTAIPATCEENGYTLHSCACGISFTSDETPAIGHGYGAGAITVSATADQPGVMSYACLTCGETTTKEIPKIEEVKLWDTVIDTIKRLPEIIGGLLDGSRAITETEFYVISGILIVVWLILFIRRRRR